MVTLGIGFGLLAATAQSLSYLFSRAYTTGRRDGGLMQLLVLAHVMQALVCLPLVWVLWPAGLPPVRQWAGPVASEAGFYLLGQVCLFVALRHTMASRVSPLLGLKVAILAGLTVVLLGDSLAMTQWAAVILAVAAAFLLNYTGGSLPWPAVLAVVGACTSYSISDLSIRLMIEAMEPVSPMRASLFGMSITYVLCGLTVAPLAPWLGTRRAEAWRAAAPYAAAWLISMVFLYMCFATAGVVLGNIVQSSRGLISIALGALLAARGLLHLEAYVRPTVFWRRVSAAVLMSLAVALFVLGR